MSIPVDNKFKAMRPPPDAAAQDQKLRDVAQMYEKHFLNQMLKSMRSTVSESGFIKVNQGEKIFREELDQEYVNKWSDKGGIGLGKLIYDQLIEKYGTQLGLKKPIDRPQGPLPLSERDQIQIKKIGQTKNSVTVSLNAEKDISAVDTGSALDAKSNAINKNDSSAIDLSLKSPWAGKLAQKMKLGADEYFLRIQHENGLESGLHWKGLLSSPEEGSEIQAGESLGYLNPDQRSMVWSLTQKNVSE